MKIERDKMRRTVSLSQNQHLQKVLSKFGIDKFTKLVTTLLAHQFKLSSQLSPQTKEERKFMAWVHMLVLLVVWYK